MRVVLLLPLVVLALTALSCSGNEPAPSPEPTVESATVPTPDISAAVEAGIAATKEAEASIGATVTAQVKATKGVEPTPALPHTPPPAPGATPQPSPAPKPTSPETDREALVSFYHATGGPNWKDNTNWLSDAPLYEWRYVAVDNGGRVIGLHLYDNRLSGQIPPELGNLANLVHLDLSDNQLSGKLPSELGNLANIESLLLQANQLTGEIPQELGSLTNLDHLVLFRNQLTGEIPPELGNLANLESLDLGENLLSGEIPAELGDLTNVESLDVSDNRLTGEIPPKLRNLVNLEYLRLWNNQLSGELPPELGDLANLESMGLHANRLTGEIPARLGNLANLESLILRENQLSGEIPAELGSLANLEYLDLRDNQLSGEMSPELGNLANLESLILRENQLSGEIPEELGNLANLEVLLLGGNQLSGEIPAELGNLANLEELRLGGNQFRGCVPSSLENQLHRLDTDLGGLPFCRGSDETTPTPPQMQTLSEREALAALYHATDGPNWRNNTNWLSDAPLEEWDRVFTDNTGRVIGLYLNDNQLTGQIPPHLGSLASLEYLDLGRNQLSGEIPSELSNLANLESMNLGGNQLSGKIPPELGSLASLKVLDLGRNQLSGCVPSGLQGQLNRTYTDLGGLPFCRGSDAPTQSSQQGKAPMMEYSRLEWVKERGKVICASRNDVPGFGYLDARGDNVGFDIDLCRAVAAAVLGDSNAIEIRLITAAERGPTIQSGEVDMLVRTVTWTTSRDAQWGNYAQTMFYDGQGFIVNKSLGVDSALDLDGASVCVTQGTTTELNLQDFSDQNGLGIEALTFEDTDAVVAAYESGQCDAFTNDRSQLAALGTALQNRDNHVILPETISEEPLGPVVPHGDDQWFDIVKMIMSILIYAEAYGIGQDNVPSAATGDTRVDRLFGLEGGFGQQSLGLSQTVAQDIVMSVGNYGEIYDRHLGPSRINLPRKNGRNALWADAPCIDCPKGGQIYAAPLR